MAGAVAWDRIEEGKVGSKVTVRARVRMKMVRRPQRAFARLALRGDEVGAELARVEEVEVLRLVRKK